MIKRYQVFVSSTYTDLREERQKIIHALMEMDCIPAGMELFPATDEAQFNFIKRVIDDSDYYILVIGGRYGTVTQTGLSYTEQEFEYASARGIKVIALLHEKPADIPLGKSESEPEVRAKLQRFRERVSSGRLVRYWTEAAELPAIVAMSLTKTISLYPAQGWIRSNSAETQADLRELVRLRQINVDLEQQLQRLRASASAEALRLAELDDSFEIQGVEYEWGSQRKWSAKVTWREIFGAIAPFLICALPATEVKELLEAEAPKWTNRSGMQYPEINDQCFQTIATQMRALDLVAIGTLRSGPDVESLHWQLTNKGDETLLKVRSVSGASAA